MKGGGIEGLIAIVVILVIIGSALMYVAIAAGVIAALYGLYLLLRSRHILVLILYWYSTSSRNYLASEIKKIKRLSRVFFSYTLLILVFVTYIFIFINFIFSNCFIFTFV